MCHFKVIVGLTATLFSLAAAAQATDVRQEGTAAGSPSWLGEELPLPLAVRTPDDLAFKETAERQYLIFNLLASGKLAYDSGDMVTAAAKWESLLAIPNLPTEVERVVRPLATQARLRAGGVAAVAAVKATEAPPKPKPVTTIRGTVNGGGSLGAGGTVVWLKRLDGPTPRPSPAKTKTITQKGKKFIPRILAIPVGTTVSFRNDDEIYHNVFSLSRPNEFDLGLYRGGVSRTKTFNAPGPVDLLCNIHTSMSAYVYVVDSPYYAQADDKGSFTIRGVPPGRYNIFAWHESSLAPTQQPITAKEGVVQVAVAVSSDRPPPPFVPDKAGKPRQPQLGY